MTEDQLWVIVTIPCSLLFGWLVVQGSKTGTMEFPQFGNTYTGRRSDQPIRFWIVAGILILITV